MATPSSKPTAKLPTNPPALAETAVAPVPAASAAPAELALPVNLAAENARLKAELAQRDTAAAQLA